MDRSGCFHPGEPEVISRSPRQRNFFSTILIVIMVSVLLMPRVATAQESDGWTFCITPYLWLLALDGKTAALGNDVPVDADFGDILDNLNIAVSANMELNNGKWFVVVDPMWSSLEMPIETDGPFGGDVEVELLIVDALVGMSVTENFDIYTGLDTTIRT
ncbi:MAG: hypothetical protein ABGY96_26195 [bacterium]